MRTALICAAAGLFYPPHIELQAAGQAPEQVIGATRWGEWVAALRQDFRDRGVLPTHIHNAQTQPFYIDAREQQDLLYGQPRRAQELPAIMDFEIWVNEATAHLRDRMPTNTTFLGLAAATATRILPLHPTGSAVPPRRRPPPRPLHAASQSAQAAIDDEERLRSTVEASEAWLTINDIESRNFVEDGYNQTFEDFKTVFNKNIKDDFLEVVREVAEYFTDTLQREPSEDKDRHMKAASRYFK